MQKLTLTTWTKQKRKGNQKRKNLTLVPTVKMEQIVAFMRNSESGF